MSQKINYDKLYQKHMEKQQQNTPPSTAPQQNPTLPLPLNQQKQQNPPTQVPPPPSPPTHDISPQDSKNIAEHDALYHKICIYLEERKINFKVIQHEATRTSQQSANIRNTPLQWGSKTMVVTGNDNNLILLIYRANMKVSWKKIRKIAFIGKKAQMAIQQQVIKLGVKPGGVPPLPSLIGLKGVLDTKFKDVETMAFNAGHMCKSIVMRTEDFPLEDLTVGDITED